MNEVESGVSYFGSATALRPIMSGANSGRVLRNTWPEILESNRRCVKCRGRKVWSERQPQWCALQNTLFARSPCAGRPVAGWIVLSFWRGRAYQLRISDLHSSEQFIRSCVAASIDPTQPEAPDLYIATRRDPSPRSSCADARHPPP